MSRSKIFYLNLFIIIDFSIHVEIEKKIMEIATFLFAKNRVLREILRKRDSVLKF